jgi:hypothetical protein
MYHVTVSAQHGLCWEAPPLGHVIHAQHKTVMAMAAWRFTLSYSSGDWLLLAVLTLIA